MIRTSLINMLRAMPHVRGRDRLADMLTRRLPAAPVRTDGGILMDLDPTEWAQQEIYLRGSSEPATLGLLRKILQPGMMFVDVGAHVGQHSLVAAAAVGASGTVIAIDPQPGNVDRIGRNASLNGFTWLLPVCAAISDRDGLVELAFQAKSDRARLSLAGRSPNDTAQRFQVSAMRLDALLQDHPHRPTVLKIDVEGYEPQVLAGATETLLRCDHIVMEHLESADETPLRLLGAAGFSLFDVTGRKWTPGAPLLEANVWARKN